MNWIKFDENDKSTWPINDKLKIIRWVYRYNVHYTITKWHVNINGRDPLYWGPRVDVLGQQSCINLYIEDYKDHKEDTLLTHWCYIDEPNDYLQEYLDTTEKIDDDLMI